MLVWYPMGVAKQAEAAIITATSSGRGSTPVASASAMAMGAMITAMALLDTSSVITVVMK
jgi:hypothetical protein